MFLLITFFCFTFSLFFFIENNEHQTSAHSDLHNNAIFVDNDDDFMGFYDGEEGVVEDDESMSEEQLGNSFASVDDDDDNSLVIDSNFMDTNNEYRPYISPQVFGSFSQQLKLSWNTFWALQMIAICVGVALFCCICAFFRNPCMKWRVVLMENGWDQNDKKVGDDADEAQEFELQQ